MKKKTNMNIKKMLSVILVSSMLASSVSTSASFIEEPETETQARLFKGTHLNEVFKMLADDPDTSLEGKDTKITAFKLANENDPIPDTAMSIAKDGDVFAWYVKDEAEPEESEGTAKSEETEKSEEAESDIPAIETDSNQMIETAEEMVNGGQVEKTDDMTIGDAVHVDGTNEQVVDTPSETGNVLESETYLNADTFMTDSADEEYHESLTGDEADITHVNDTNDVVLAGDENISSEIDTNPDPVSNSVDVDNENKEISFDNSIDEMEEKDKKDEKSEKDQSTIKVDGEEKESVKLDETVKVDDALGAETKETKVDETIKVDDVLGAENEEKKEELISEETTEENKENTTTESESTVESETNEITDKTEIDTDEKKEDTEIKAEDTEINVDEAQSEIDTSEKIDVKENEDAKIDVDDTNTEIEVDENQNETEDKTVPDLTEDAGEIKAQEESQDAEKSEITDMENTEVKEDSEGKSEIPDSDIPEEKEAEQTENKDDKSEVEGSSEETKVEEKTENKDETDTEKTEAEDESKIADEKTEEQSEGKIEDTESETSDEKTEDAESETSDENTEEKSDEETDEVKDEKSDEESEEVKEETSKEDKTEKSEDETSKDDESDIEKSKDEESEDKSETETSDEDKKDETDKAEDTEEKDEKDGKSEDKEDEDKEEDEKEDGEEKAEDEKSEKDEKTEDEEGDSDKESESDDVVEIKETGVIYIRATVPVKMNKDSSYLFYNLEALEDIGPFADFDFSEVKDASYMFAGTKADLSKTVTWNPEKLEKAEGIFDTELTPGWYQEWLAKKEIKEEEKEEKEVELVKKEEEDEDVDVNTSLVPADRVGTEELQALLDNSTVSDPEMDDEINAIAEIMKYDPENEALKQMAAIESGITGEVMGEVQEAIEDDKTAVPEEIAEAAKNAELATEEDVEENKKLLKKAEKGGNVNIAGEDAEPEEVDLTSLTEQAKEGNEFEGEIPYEEKEVPEPTEIDLVNQTEPEEEVELVGDAPEEVELVDEPSAQADPEQVELVGESETAELTQPTEENITEDKTEENVELVGGNVDFEDGAVESNSIVDKVLDVFSTDVEAATPKPTPDDKGNTNDKAAVARQDGLPIAYAPRDTFAESQAYVSHLYVTKMLDGTAPFDKTDEGDGNDRTKTNKKVRSYDQIIYTLTYSTALTTKNIYNTINNAKLMVSYEISGYNPNQLSFDEASMPWLKGKKLFYKDKTDDKWKPSTQVATKNVSGMILQGYRTLPVSEGSKPYCIPGAGTLNCVINVKSVVSGKKIQPTFCAWLETAKNKSQRSTDTEMYSKPGKVVDGNEDEDRSKMMKTDRPPEVTTTAGLFFSFTFNKTSTYNRVFDRHTTESDDKNISEGLGIKYLNPTDNHVEKGHGRGMQMVWTIKITKPNGGSKGCTVLDSSKDVTVKVKLDENNVPPITKGEKNPTKAQNYFAQFTKYGLIGLRTHDMGKYYIKKGGTESTDDGKETEAELKKTLTPMSIIAYSNPLDGQGGYDNGSLSSSGGVYTFKIKPGTNVNPGDTLTSGEFILFSEQPVNTQYDEEDGEGIYLKKGHSPQYILVATPVSISGYAEGINSAITRTFGDDTNNSLQNTIEGGGGYHSHIWLNYRKGSNLSGSSYYATSGIGAYNEPFNIKQYEYMTFTSKELENDSPQTIHSRKTWIMWDNRYVDIDIDTDGTLKYIALAGQLASWEDSQKSNWKKMSQGKTLNHTKMVFLTKKNGSKWSSDEEMYEVNLLPGTNSDLKFYNTYAKASEGGQHVCGVVIENFDFDLQPDVRNYLGIIFGMKFTGDASIIGKSQGLGFTTTTVTFHQHKSTKCKRKSYVLESRQIPLDGVYRPNVTNPTLGATNGNSTYDIREHLDYYWNGQSNGKNGSQNFWINGEHHREKEDPVKWKIVRNNIIEERKYRPTKWVDGVATGLNGHSHPHEGNSMYVMGDTNKVEVKNLYNNSMTDILKLGNDADKLTALQAKKSKTSTVNDISMASRLTFVINPSWSSTNGTSNRPATLYIPTALLSGGSGTDREIVSVKEDTGAIMEYLYASKKDSSGNATSVPVRVTPGTEYDVSDFVSGTGVTGKFTVVHASKSSGEMKKYLEQDKYCGDPYSGRTVFIRSGNNALTVDSKGKLSFSAKSEDNKYQQWKIVIHPSGAFAFVNVATNYELDNGGKEDVDEYDDPQACSTHKYSTSEDNLLGAFKITGSLESATIKSVLGNYTLVNSGGAKLSSSGSATWTLDSINEGNTTGYIVKFTGLNNKKDLPLFFVEYFLDKENLDASQTIKQNVYIVESNPAIDVSTGGRSSTSTVNFVDVRTGVIKETVDTRQAATRELNGGQLITYTLTFHNIFDDQRYMNVKCLPPKNNDANGTILPAGAKVDVKQSSLAIASSLGEEAKNKFSVSINEADGGIYAAGIMEPSEKVSITYSIKVYGMANESEGYVRNNCTLILEKVVNAKGTDVITATDATGKALKDRDGLRVDSNRVETYFKDKSVPTSPTPDEPDEPPPPDTPITTIAPSGEITKRVNRVSNNVGEDHTWTIDTRIPPRSDYPTDWHYDYDEDGYEIARWREDADIRSYTITDTIDNRLDYRGNLKVLLNGSDITSSCTITKPSVNFAGGPISVSIQNANLLERMASEGGYITLQYNTRINMTAEPGKEDNSIPNQASYSYTGVKYFRSGNGTGSTGWSGNATSNEPYVYTGDTEVFKYNTLNHDFLKGAVISIYTADGHIVRRRSEYPVNYGDEGYDSLTENYLARTDEDGRAYFYGLKDGTYYFKEVSPPRGFEWNKNESARTRISEGQNQDYVDIYNNPYQDTTVEKSIDKNEWLTHEIHTWTITGHIPQYFTDEEYAECQYQFIDEIDYQELDITKKRLDYRGNVKVFVAGSEMRRDYHYSVQEDAVFDSTTGRQRVIKLTVTMLPPGITAISDAAKNDGWKTNTVVLQYDTSINERAREHEIIPNRVELNYCGFGVRRYAKSDLRIVPSQNPLDVWDWNNPDTPGYPHEFGEPGGHLVKQDPRIAEQYDEWLIDDPYVYTGYRVLKINCIIDQKYDPYEDISFTYDIDGYPCYDKTKKLHWTVIINPVMDGDSIEAYVWDTCETKLYRSKAQYGNEFLIYLPPGTYTVNQRKPMRYDLVESKPEVENAYKVPGSFAIENNLIPYHDAEDTFVNVLRQWNMHSSAYLEKNEPGLREKLRGYLNIVLINGPKSVTVTNQDTGEDVFSDTVANAHCIKIDYGRYDIYVDGDLKETVDLQQYSMQRRYIIVDE